MNIKEFDVAKFRDKLFDRMDDLMILPEVTDVSKTYNAGLKTMCYTAVAMLIQECTNEIIAERKVEA